MTHYFDTYSTLAKSPNLGKWEDGDTAFIEDTKEIYNYKDGQWTKPTEQVHITEYELNKQIYAQQAPLPVKKIRMCKEAIRKWAKNTNNTYFMLLNHELRYFTLLVKEKDSSLFTIGDEVLNCVFDLGEIVAYSDEGNGIELWVKQNEMAYCLHLFPYDLGIVKCRE